MSDLLSTIKSIVNTADESLDFATLIGNLQTQDIQTLFSTLSTETAITLNSLRQAPIATAELDTAKNVVEGLNELALSVVNEDILPDINPGDTDTDVLFNTFSNLLGKITELEASGIDTSVFPSLDFPTALGYISGLNFNPTFTTVDDINTVEGTGISDSLVNAQNGNFVINGNAGNDLISNLGFGKATINGGEGNDIISNISRLASTVSGGEGQDWILNIGTNSNRLFGGADNDVIVNIGSDRNRIKGDDGNDTIINFGEDDNRLIGGKGDDLIVHIGGDAKLIGGGGKDVLIGGLGDDELVGGGGSDVLLGGGGADTFTLGLKVNDTGAGFEVLSSGADTIADFYASESDIIALEVRGTGASQVTGSTLNFNTATGELSFDGTTLATMSGVSSFDTNAVQVTYL